MNAPYLVTSNKKINTAYRLAISTLAANIIPFKDGILTEERPVMIAGLGYVTPWTRDASINTWNAGGLICPEVTLDTLRAVVGKNEKGYFIDGEYWDRIIWTIGAWYQYLYTGDKEFLALAYEAVCNSLEHFENTEFSSELNLFRGAACYGDGVAAYPDIYASHGMSGIIEFSKCNREHCVDTGVGIPMHTLSTNCLYYYAYVLADKMGKELGKEAKYARKAEKMKKAVNEVFWDADHQNYRYIHDQFGGCDHLEGMGLAFAILFDIADDEQKRAILKNTPVSDHGITCVYPSFSRYDTPDGMGFGRHSGTVWPHVQGFWADAAASCGDIEKFDYELSCQTENAVRYYQFAEIYHPINGTIYGGRQEDRCKGIREWPSENVQTWSATAYLRNIYMDLFGMSFTPDGISFNPVGSSLVENAELSDLLYRNANITIKINGSGAKVASFKINGKESDPFVSNDASGKVVVEIEMAK